MNTDQIVAYTEQNKVSNGKAAYIARAASLAAGFPTTSAASSVNRFCSSGLKAVQDIANQISNGSIECGVAIGAESMSEGGDRLEKPFHDAILENPDAKDCMQPMGQTSENVAKDFEISREAQDRFATESYQRAERAQKAGWFDDEIVPFPVTVKDPKTGEEKKVTLTKDEGPRYGTTFESLSKVRPAFPAYGDRSTGGNSSQVTDGGTYHRSLALEFPFVPNNQATPPTNPLPLAAAILLMKRSTAQKMNQPILGKFCGATVAGVAPRIMGIGPSLAIPKLLGKFNLNLQNDIDIIELNEAFASMAVYCIDVLGIDPAKMNVRGGAIALGHPLGATGARQICTGLSECRRQKKRILLTSMCIGTGQGMAGLFVNEQL